MRRYIFQNQFKCRWSVTARKKNMPINRANELVMFGQCEDWWERNAFNQRYKINIEKCATEMLLALSITLLLLEGGRESLPFLPMGLFHIHMAMEMLYCYVTTSLTRNDRGMLQMTSVMLCLITLQSGICSALHFPLNLIWNTTGEHCLHKRYLGAQVVLILWPKWKIVAIKQQALKFWDWNLFNFTVFLFLILAK